MAIKSFRATLLNQKGIALIMSLSVILLLSIALMKTFENRTVETVHLENSLRQFQAETLSRSVFRAILIAVKTKGLVFVKSNQSAWKNIPLPISNDQYFQIIDIKPVDHLFNLNRRFRADDAWPEVLKNILNDIRVSNDPLAIELQIDELYPLLSAINDWIDVDINQDEEFLYNFEDYIDAQPEFEVKNRAFDRLSEIKNIYVFDDLDVSLEDIRSRFRIFSGKEMIDVNLATVTDVEDFLSLFKDVPKYPNVYEFRSEIAQFLEIRDEEQGQEDEGLGFSDPDSRFKPPLNSRSGTWKQMLTSENINLNPNELELFSATTDHLLINFSVTAHSAVVTTEALVKLTYESSSSLNIKQFEILSYQIR